MKAKELSALADPNNGRAPRQIVRKGKPQPLKKHPLDPIFVGCWISTEDPGPYGFGVNEPVPWPRICLADRFVALLNIRQLTYGNFEWRVKCRNPACELHKKGFVWEIDCTELEVKPMPAATIEKIKNKDFKFPVTIAGKECVFELLTGSKEANRPELSADLPSHKKMLAQVASRLVTIDGRDVDPESDDVLDWVGNLDIPDLHKASKDMDAVDGGVEVRTIIECPECGTEWTADVPFDDPAFLTPTPK